jgi:3-oxoacyl-[acyl-carrier protein] reductase
MRQMSNRAVLVTGASRGIGQAVAAAFARCGDRVAVHRRTEEGAADALVGLPGEGHILVYADLADPEAVRRMVDQANAELGGLDIVINNAGIDRPHLITETDYQQWQAAWHDIFAVNLMGAANVTWCAVQHMKGTGGRIINMSSQAAFGSDPHHPAYGASKAALNAFGHSLVRVLAPHNISVATVAPGFVNTDMSAEDLRSPRGKELRAGNPFQKVATPEEIAIAVVYMASDAAEWASMAMVDLTGSYLR